jgi:hypothetical protein
VYQEAYGHGSLSEVVFSFGGILQDMAKMKRSIRKPKDLRDAAAHVNYEIEMLVYSASFLGGWHSSPMTTPAGNTKNMALESFLLHFRNLRAFLCPRLQPVVLDDVCASDFLDEPEERNLGDAEKLSVGQARINKMLAHLSYSRDKYIAAGDYGWKVASMIIVVLEEMQNSFAALNEERRSWFLSVSKIEASLSDARLRVYEESK